MTAGWHWTRRNRARPKALVHIQHTKMYVWRSWRTMCFLACREGYIRADCREKDHNILLTWWKQLTIHSGWPNWVMMRRLATAGTTGHGEGDDCCHSSWRWCPEKGWRPLDDSGHGEGDDCCRSCRWCPAGNKKVINAISSNSVCCSVLLENVPQGWYILGSDMGRTWG